jgi:hypothetical protein
MKAWIIIQQDQPICIDGRLPVYWARIAAEQDAEKHGGIVKRFELNWDKDD